MFRHRSHEQNTKIRKLKMTDGHILKMISWLLSHLSYRLANLAVSDDNIDIDRFQ